jgi:hypothetical protein
VCRSFAPAARLLAASLVRPRLTGPLRPHLPLRAGPVPPPFAAVPQRGRVRVLVVLGKQDCGRCGFPHEIYGYPGDELDA